jgi:hypothetical protein
MHPLVMKATGVALTGGWWLIKKLGPAVVVTRIEAAVEGIGNRQKAIAKARSLTEGRFGSVIIEDKARWVVFAGESPRAVFPGIEGNLDEEMRDFDLSRLRTPDDLNVHKTRQWANEQLRGLATRLRRGDQEAAPTSERDGKAPPAADGRAATATATRQSALGEMPTVTDRAEFSAAVAGLPTLLDVLSGCPALPLAEHPAVPEAPGVYLFSEGPTPFYVGNTRNLRRRLRQYAGANSPENEAALAWRLALDDAEQRGIVLTGTRKELEADADFSEVFRAARDRVRQMDVRFVEIDDPITRTLFEVYATQALGTERFNSFETH